VDNFPADKPTSSQVAARKTKSHPTNSLLFVGRGGDPRSFRLQYLVHQLGQVVDFLTHARHEDRGKDQEQERVTDQQPCPSYHGYNQTVMLFVVVLLVDVLISKLNAKK
jgi:hypothetical protein